MNEEPAVHHGLTMTNWPEAMTKRVRCKKPLCFKTVLEQTAVDNDGLCMPCYKRKHGKTKANTSKVCGPSEHELPASELTDRQKRSQLSFAVREQDPSRVKEILDTGFDPTERPPHSTETWFGEAINGGGNLEVLELLHSVGCDPNTGTKSPDNTTPLEVAVRKERIEAIEWLMQNGADPNIGRPIMAAINYRIEPECQLKMLTLLMNGGAEINQTFALYGDEDDRVSVLDWATIYDIAEPVVEFLKSNGAKHHTGSNLEKLKKQLKLRRIV